MGREPFMNEQQIQTPDPIIDQVRQTRERLVREHGGLRGWVEHLKKLQAQHPEKLVSRPEQPSR